MIQGRSLARNIDSKNVAPGFDCCPARCSSPTLSTASVRSGRFCTDQRCLLNTSRADMLSVHVNVRLVPGTDIEAIYGAVRLALATIVVRGFAHAVLRLLRLLGFYLRRCGWGAFRGFVEGFLHFGIFAWVYNLVLRPGRLSPRQASAPSARIPSRLNFALSLATALPAWTY